MGKHQTQDRQAGWPVDAARNVVRAAVAAALVVGGMAVAAPVHLAHADPMPSGWESGGPDRPLTVEEAEAYRAYEWSLRTEGHEQTGGGEYPFGGDR